MKRAEPLAARIGRGDLVALGVAVLAHSGLLLTPSVMPSRQRLVARSSHGLDVIDVVLLPPSDPGQPGKESAASERAPTRAAAASALPARVGGRELERTREPPAPAEAATPPASPPAPDRVAVSAERAPSSEPSPPAVEAQAPEQTPGAGAAAAGASKPAPGLLDEYGGPPSLAGPGDLGVPGLGGAPVYTLPGALPPPNAAAPAPTAVEKAAEVPRDVANHVLGGTLRKRDREAGIELPAAGVVTSVIADAVRAAAPAEDSRATFEVKLGAGGAVESVRVVSSTHGDAGHWGRVVGRARSSLASRSLSPPGPGGATLRVKVETTHRYPAGSKKQIDVAPVCVEDVVKQIEQFVEDPSSAGAGSARVPSGRPMLGVGSNLPGPNGERRRFCIPVGVGGTGDASNVGAHLQTVVKSSVEIVRSGERALPSDRAMPVDDRAPWLPSDPNKAARPAKPKKKKKPSSPG